MAVAFEHYGQTVAPATAPAQPRTPQPQAVPAYMPPQAQAKAAPRTGQSAALLWGACALAYACVVATLGVWMASDGSLFQVWWWQTFGWRGFVDLPLVLLPLGVVLAVCLLPVLGVTALVQWVRG